MKVLVAYTSLKGNIKNVAETINCEIIDENDIRSIGEVQDFVAYDLLFLDFPTHRSGPVKKIRKFLQRHSMEGRTVALIVTHGTHTDLTEVPGWKAMLKRMAARVNFVYIFDYQEELSKLEAHNENLYQEECTNLDEDEQGQ
jgi:flavodoxin